MLGIRRKIEFKENHYELSAGISFISQIKEIKSGNQLLRNKFISDYKPFVVRVVSNTLGKYIDMESSDEFSIGLAAFNEAIECFDLNKKYNFFLFSEQVIKRRILNFIRKNKGSHEYPFSYFDDQDKFEQSYLASNSYFSFEDVEIKDEIICFRENLACYGISLMDLVENAPKHRDSVILCIKIARALSEDGDLFDYLVRTKNIPRKRLKNIAKVHSRTVGNNRIFIIALCLIFKSDLELSKRYLKFAEDNM